MKIGIIGLPNVGKSTLFKILTSVNVEIADYPFTTINPNIGITNLFDDNLSLLAKFFNSKKITYSRLKFVDIAGLVKGAHKGEGLGNQFLSYIKEMDILIHIINGFKDNSDIEEKFKIVNLELILKDIETIEKKLLDIKNKLKSKPKEYLEEKDILLKIKQILNQELLLYDYKFSNCELEYLKRLNLLTFKPQILLINISEHRLINKNYLKINSNFPQINICLKFEEELLELPKNERKYFLNEYNLKNLGTEILIKMCFKNLNLINFYTANQNEAKSWIIKKGSTLKTAAEKIHSDFKEKFICAEVINIKKLFRFKSYLEAKKAGAISIKSKFDFVNHQDLIFIKI